MLGERRRDRNRPGALSPVARVTKLLQPGRFASISSDGFPGPMAVTQKRPTITNVAALAGVSVGTVSNVLNGTIPVSESRRERVMQVIQELGYSQNVLAQGLRKKRSPIVGVCVPHTSIAYFSALMEAF